MVLVYIPIKALSAHTVLGYLDHAEGKPKNSSVSLLRWANKSVKIRVDT
jgi:hypothetical protein